MRFSKIIISIFVICLLIAGCSSPTDESKEGHYIYRPEDNPILAFYCTENAWVGTSLEGANANPPIPLPPNRSSLASLEEDQLVYTIAFCGFLPPEGYDIIGSQTALKLVKELNIDRLVEQWGGE